MPQLIRMAASIRFMILFILFIYKDVSSSFSSSSQRTDTRSFGRIRGGGPHLFINLIFLRFPFALTAKCNQ